VVTVGSDVRLLPKVTHPGAMSGVCPKAQRSASSEYSRLVGSDPGWVFPNEGIYSSALLAERHRSRSPTSVLLNRSFVKHSKTGVFPSIVLYANPYRILCTSNLDDFDGVLPGLAPFQQIVESVSA
jgi:hypothetical protein